MMVGTMLGPYRVVEKVGEGGMGEVYRARDTKLGRDVALKVLPEAFARDPAAPVGSGASPAGSAGRLARFEREARVLASLSHPNIAVIHGIEESGPVPALVMEFVEGEDLAQRLARGPIPVPEAVSIAAQIAHALEAAHERGVVHRDLKPANVKVTPAGTVKVLDFGLAKAFDAASDPVEAGTAAAPPPTISAFMSQPGLVMGTASYMAPEQARGEAVDRRADIWAFGCVLYEMLTGTRPFTGRTVSDVLAAVLRQDVDWAALPADTPASVRRLIERCLVREPRGRLRDIGDALLELSAPAEPAGSAPQPVARRSRATWEVWIAVTGLAAILGVAAGSLVRWQGAPSAPVTRFEIRLPADHTMYIGLNAGLALSPDGRRLLIGGFAAERPVLLSQSLDEFESHALPGSEWGTSPFFSPDGQWAGFIQLERRQLMKVRVGGGQPVAICTAAAANAATWGPDDTVVFVDQGGLMQVSADGGTPAPLTTIDRAAGEVLHTAPRWRAGRTVFFTVVGSGAPRVAAVSADGGPHRLIAEGTTPLGLAHGRLIYGLGSAIVSAPFDESGLAITGPSSVIVADVRLAGSRFLADMSLDGTLVYQPAFSDRFALVWVDRSGNVVPALSQPRAYDAPRLSPDDRRVAVGIRDVEGRDDVWVFDLERGSSVRLTSDGRSVSPIWMPDGRILVTSMDEAGRPTLVIVSPDGTTPPEHIDVPELLVQADSVSPDGRVVAITETGPGVPRRTYGGGSSVSLLPRGGTARPLAPPPDATRAAVFSPDGRWLAYQLSGQIQVRPGSGSGVATPVSASDRGVGDSGWQPAWSRDGRELYYRNSNRIMRVEVEPATGRVSAPVALFESPFTVFRGDDFFRAQYDVARDGRFLMVRNEAPGDQVRVILNVQVLPALH